MGTGTRETTNAEVVRAGYAALNRGDAGAVLDVLSPEATFGFRAAGETDGVLHGADALARFYAALVTAFDRVRIDCREIEADGDTVKVRGVLSLRERATARSSRASFRHAFRLRQGRVVTGLFEDPVHPLDVIRGAGRSVLRPAP